MTKKQIIVIGLCVIIPILAISAIIPAYLQRQNNDLLTVQYYCGLGMKPTGFTGWKSFDNGTHTITMDSCVWIKNIDIKTGSSEYQEINSMSCDDLIQKFDKNEPFQYDESEKFAKAKLDNCNFVDNIKIPEPTDSSETPESYTNDFKGLTDDEIDFYTEKAINHPEIIKLMEDEKYTYGSISYRLDPILTHFQITLIGPNGYQIAVVFDNGEIIQYEKYQVDYKWGGFPYKNN